MPPKFPIYLDHHATTPVDPAVFEAMRPAFTEDFGNASSRSHAFGWKAADAVKKGRAQCAELMNADPDEILFTSGATESINLALLGVAGRRADRGGRFLTTRVEHRAVLDTFEELRRLGFQVEALPVDSTGRLSPQTLAQALTHDTLMVSILAANNEIGTLNPVSELAALVKTNKSLLHVDAAQALGKVPVDVKAWGADFVSASAHKLYGPKGVGLLWAKEAVLDPILHGGGQERGLRPGTLNVPGIVGFGKACELAGGLMAEEGPRVAKLRDRLQEKILAAVSGARMNGHPTDRLPNNLSLSFEGVDGSELLMGLEGLAVSSGSACSSNLSGVSHVLRALGMPEKQARATLRFGLGRFNTEEEIDYAAGEVVRQVERLRRLYGAPA